MPDLPEDFVELDPISSRCLTRTRSGVMNVLVVDGLSILASALILRFGPDVDLPFDAERMRNATFGGLFVVFAGALMTLRGLGSRDRLANPGTRASRFFFAHVGAAAIGWVATPLGLAYGLGVEPELRGLLPFWLAALVIGRLAYPRPGDLADFDEPPADSESSI